jgi:hypothetical protein
MHPNSQEYFNAIQANLLHQKRLAEASTLSLAGFPMTYLLSWMKSMEQRRLEDVKIMESLKNQVEALTEKIANSGYLQRDSSNSTSSEHFSKPENVQVPQESRAGEVKIEEQTETSVHEREVPESVIADGNPSDFCDDDGSLEDGNDTESTEPNDGDHAVSSKFDISRDTVNLLSDEINEFIESSKQTMKTRGKTLICV